MVEKLAIITSHPIQYNAPLFAMLSQRGKIKIKVFYTWGEQAVKEKFDPGFGKSIEWDIPLLQGYDYVMVRNISLNPGSHHFYGINNPTLIDEVRHWEAEAILVYGWSFESHLRAIRYFHGKIPVLFRGDSTWMHKKNWVKEVCRKLFLEWVYRKVDIALYVGTHNNSYYRQVGLSHHQLVFAPHAVDNDRFETQSARSHAAVNKWKEQLGIKTEELVFLYAGKLDKNKNVGLLLSAFKKLNSKNTHLIIAGNGETEVLLKKECGELRGVHFMPFQNQSVMPLLYSVADIFVLPSLSETWGLSINEAMACGCAVLASSGCGAAIDLILEGRNGYIFSNNNEDDLVSKMRLLIRDRTKITDYREASKMIINNWTFERVCVAIEGCLANIEK